MNKRHNQKSNQNRKHVKRQGGRQGGMTKQTLCRQAAHNLHERREVQEALKERGISPVRRRYLNERLARLNKEKQFFERIAKDPKEGFRITDKDCFVI